MSSSSSSLGDDVGLIQRLPSSVVDRIAAGEVIHRPSSALKELLENALDARASAITVTVGGGGLRLLSVQDNGCGIAPRDLPLLCERFATSKLRDFAALAAGAVGTYGFRGEAMASISHVAAVTVVSAAAGAPHAHRAAYADGKLLGEPKPCAGVRGTLVLSEALLRRMAGRWTPPWPLSPCTPASEKSETQM